MLLQLDVAARKKFVMYKTYTTSIFFIMRLDLLKPFNFLTS